MGTRAVACGLWVCVALSSATDALLEHANRTANPWTLAPVLLVNLLLASLAVAIIVLHPGNAIGWLLLAISLVGPLGEALSDYAVYALYTRPGSLPIASTAAAVGVWASPLGLILTMTMVLLLFPTGRVVAPRWRPLLALALLAVALYTIGIPLAPLSDADSRFVGLYAPLGSPATKPIGELLVTAAGVIAVVTCAGSLLSMAARIHRARGVERQQLKWLALVAIVIIGAIASVLVTEWLGLAGTLWEKMAWNVLMWSFLFGLPAAIAVALLRHNLYDIDRIINRALVYGLLSLTLGGAYVALVLSLTAIVGALTGESSAVVTALSTLGVAALFQPLRARIQAGVDRRFYRRHYDAARLIEQFSNRLRDNIQINTLSEELLEVVRETMQPEHASLWLRSLPDRARSTDDHGG